MDTIICRDIYVRRTEINGGTAVRCRRVWDAKRFIDAQQREAAASNQGADDGAKRLAKAEQITEDQYRKERR
jgi:flagellar hook-associated protein FlgK